MKARRLFNIDILQLSIGSHQYEFDIESSFFENFEDSFIEKGKLKAIVTLDKSETLLQADFAINGYVELVCDRSLENFDYPISTQNHLIFKYGSEFSELTDEIITIPRDTPSLNMAQYIYEFIGLAIPMKKLHPKFQTEEEDEKEDETEGILIYTTIKEGEEEIEDPADGSLDPRWEILNNIKKNLN
jgi:uncharacterized protein